MQITKKIILALFIHKGHVVLKNQLQSLTSNICFLKYLWGTSRRAMMAYFIKKLVKYQ